VRSHTGDSRESQLLEGWPAHSDGRDIGKPILTIAIPTYNRSKYLSQLLHSLAEQIRNDDRVALLISDNASTDDTAAVVEEQVRCGVDLEYVRNAENIGPDANFLQCYELARTKYVWIIGDDDLLRPGAVPRILDLLLRDEYDLVYVCQSGFSIDCPDLQPLTAKKEPLYFTNAEEFLRRVHISTTMISANIINKDRVNAVDHEPFSKLVGSNLIQLGWTLTALRGHSRSLFVREKLLLYRTANTGGYGVSTVFGATLAQVTHAWLGIPRLDRLILNASLQRLLPFCLLAANRKAHREFHEEDSHALLSAVFRDNFRYWFFDYPMIVLPSNLAWLWWQMLRVVNRIDRAFGLPLLGW